MPYSLEHWLGHQYIALEKDGIFIGVGQYTYALRTYWCKNY